MINDTRDIAEKVIEKQNSFIGKIMAIGKENAKWFEATQPFRGYQVKLIEGINERLFFFKNYDEIVNKILKLKKIIDVIENLTTINVSDWLIVELLRELDSENDELIKLTTA